MHIAFKFLFLASVFVNSLPYTCRGSSDMGSDTSGSEDSDHIFGILCLMQSGCLNIRLTAYLKSATPGKVEEWETNQENAFVLRNGNVMRRLLKMAIFPIGYSHRSTCCYCTHSFLSTYDGN